MKYSMASAVLAIFFIASAQTTIDLSGTIKNQASFPVRNIETSLKLMGLKATTDSVGNFRIYKPNAVIVMPWRQHSAFLQFRKSQFIILSNDANERASISVFDLKGSRISHLDRTLRRGENVVPLLSSGALVSPSMLVAVVEVGSQITTFRLALAGSGEYLVREYTGNAAGNSLALAKANASPPLDSLRFIRRLTVEGVAKEIVEYSIPIAKWTDKFKITLDMIPYEAVEWGKTQVGRGPDSVGAELGTAPNGVYPYRFSTYYNGAWCTEFHCYILRIAGCPLGTDAGAANRPNWLKSGNDGLQTWYTSNTVQKTEFIDTAQLRTSSYIPVPGDFVHLVGHTATVQYMQGTTLYCIDGNNGNQVRLVNRGNYKTVSNLLGYGRRTGVVGNSWQSVP